MNIENVRNYKQGDDYSDLRSIVVEGLVPYLLFCICFRHVGHVKN